MLTIYHNPRCSKSREALALVEAFAAERDVEVEVIEYLKTPPSRSQLAALQKMLDIGVAAMVRENEAEYAELGLGGAGDEALLDALAMQPKLLQRPIVVFGTRAVIGRPPENVASLFATPA